MKLTVILGASGEASFDINLIDNSFVRKWVEEFQWCLDNCELNQADAFADFLTPEKAVNRLTESCVVINRYLKDFIEIKSDLLNQSQDYFNYLHLKFEQLSGPFGKPTRLLSVANDELKDAIRNLNSYTHLLECKNLSGKWFYLSFNKNQYRRKPLEIDDYQFFEFQSPPGTLFLHYAELGKEYLDLFEDGLPISYANAKNLHYFSGEASLLFSEFNDFEKYPGYEQWLIDNNIDPYDKSLGHGKIPLGIVDDVDLVKDLVSKHKFIKSIKVQE